MSILRKQQIQQVLDDENIIKRQVLNRVNSALKGYKESVLPAQIIDNDIVDNNKRDVNNFISLINELYLILRHTEDKLFELLTGHPSEYRRYLQLLNITKYYVTWEALMKEYSNFNLNYSTKDELKKNLIKIEAYVQEIDRLLEKNIIVLCNIWVYTHIGGPTYMLKSIITNLHADADATEEEIYNYVAYLEKKISGINSIQLLKEHIETRAFFMVLHKQHKSNKYGSVSADDIAFEITGIIKTISSTTQSKHLERILIHSFDRLLPEIAPYYTEGYDDFKEQRDELNRQAVPPPQDDGEDGDNEEYVPQEYVYDGQYNRQIEDEDNMTQYSNRSGLPPLRHMPSFGAPSNELQRIHEQYMRQRHEDRQGQAHRMHGRNYLEDDNRQYPTYPTTQRAPFNASRAHIISPDELIELTQEDATILKKMVKLNETGFTDGRVLSRFKKYDRNIILQIIHQLKSTQDKQYLQRFVNFHTVQHAVPHTPIIEEVPEPVALAVADHLHEARRAPANQFDDRRNEAYAASGEGTGEGIDESEGFY